MKHNYRDVQRPSFFNGVNFWHKVAAKYSYFSIVLYAMIVIVFLVYNFVIFPNFLEDFKGMMV